VTTQGIQGLSFMGQPIAIIAARLIERDDNDWAIYAQLRHPAKLDSTAQGDVEAVRGDESSFRGYGGIADQTLTTLTLVSVVSPDQ
jgi:hypothetical protein